MRLVADKTFIFVRILAFRPDHKISIHGGEVALAEFTGPFNYDWQRKLLPW